MRERLRALGLAAMFTWTARPGHASELAARLAEAGEDTVVAVGGDGTVDEVLQGLRHAGRGALGILPLGTGNDAARTLGIPLDLAGAAANVASGSRRRVDLLAAGDRVVLNAVGIGLLGAINVNAAKVKWVRGMSAYLAAGVGTLVRYRCPEIELRSVEVTASGSAGTPTASAPKSTAGSRDADATAPPDTAVTIGPTTTSRYSGPMTILAIHNGVTTGGGFPLCPAALPDDGTLDATLVTATNLLSRLGAVGDCLRGTLGRRAFTRELRATRFELACSEPLPCHWDGNPARIEPPGLTFDVLPAALEVVAPQRAAGADAPRR